MTIRVRPADVEVPPDDPFQNDLLDRKPSIETLTSLLGSLEGPCVLALDSEWGGGKTTFMKMWAAYLRNEHYAVVEFNAWETDFSGDPFVALSSRLQQQLDDTQTDDADQSIERFKVAAKRIALRTAPIAIRLLSQGLLESGSLEQAIAEEASSYVEDRLEEFDEVEKSFVDFKESLQEGAARLSEKHDNHPLFIMIDELDRCRPSYAIELLEVAKHLFSVDQIVFVLALNRTELAHSVRALYGVEFDAKGYLYRFFDLDYTLPAPNREKFVLQAVRDTGLSTYFPDGVVVYEAVPNMIARMLAASKLDLRRIAQTIRRLSLICPPPGRNSTKTAAAASVGVILRTLDGDLYARYCNFECGDDEVVEYIYSHGEIGSIQDSPEGHVFEAIVCLMWCEISTRFRDYTIRFDESPLLSGYRSSLQQIYERRTDAGKPGSRIDNSQEDDALESRCRGAINAASIMSQGGWGLFCSEALNRIELLPTNDA